MRITRSVLLFSFQFLLTYIILFCIYMVFAVLDNDEFDMVSEIGLLTIHPIFAILFSGITIVLCFLVGLPLRINPTLHKYWINRPIIALTIVFVGIILLSISLHSRFAQTALVMVNSEQVKKQIPSAGLALTGWVLTAFGLLHFYPLMVIKRIKASIFRQNNI